MVQALIFLLVAVSFVGCSRNDGGPGIELFPDMVHPVPYEAFSENTVTPKGMTMMDPVKGTVARGHMPFVYGTGDKEAQRAGIELVNPIEKSEAVLARGQKAYESYCLACHGITGKGDGPLIPQFPNPPSFTLKNLKAYPDGRLYHVIVRGMGDMPSHGAQVKEKDRWAIVHYIRKLQGN